MKIIHQLGMASATLLLSSIFILAASEVAGETAPNRSLDQAAVEMHSALLKFIDPEGIIVDYLADKPTPEDCALGRPNAIGWWSPIENGPMLTGTYMYAACERARRSGSGEDKALARRLARGLIKCASVSDVPGFIARGVGTDGRCHYPLSSGDQVYSWFYGLFTYCKSGFATGDEVAEISGKMVEVGNAMQAANWSTRCDGVFKGQSRDSSTGHMYRDVSCYLFALRALYELSGDPVWLKRYQQALSERPRDSAKSRAEICALGYAPDREDFKNLENWAMYLYVAPQLYMMALSQMETDPDTQKMYRESCRLNAQYAVSALAKAQNFDNDNQLVFGYRNWRNVFTAWFPQKTQEDAKKLSEVDRYKPECKRSDYEYALVLQPLGGAAVAAFSDDEEVKKAVEKTLLHYDYNRLNYSRFLYAECAYYALTAQKK